MEYKKLGDYCNIISSKRIFAEQYVSEGIPFYRSKEIIEKNNNQNISEPLFISKETYETIKEKFGVPEENDILLTSVGTLGIPYIVKNETFYFKDGNLTWLKDFKKELNQKYLYYWLSSKFGYKSLTLRAIGSSQPALTIDILKKYKLFIPPLPTQQKIASILSVYDNLIQNYKKQIEALQTAASELYKEWFVRFRFPGYQTTEFENGIPKGWKVVLASELGEFIRGKNITAEEMKEGMIPVISAGIEPSGFHNQSNVKGVSLTISNSGANAGYLQINYSDIWAADCSYCNSAKHIYFYYELLNNMRVVLFNLQKGAAQPHVYAKDINKMKILLPPSELIETANNKIKLMHEKIYSLQQQITNLTQQRDLLLPRLMSGKLEVE